MKETINKDTYQTLKEVKVNSEQALRAVTPMWKKNTNESSVSLFVATPVHSECSIHYTQALLELQQICFKHKIKVTFSLIKSSLVTQGRNLCVAGFLESNYTHMLFIDSDIYFDSSSIIEMIKRDKELISIPYPLKTIMWDKALHKIEKGLIHSPTGCMMIKRSVFDKMIKAYPDKNIIQKTVINGEYVNRPNLWNFFDTLHDPITKTYMGEDFSFCQRWKDIGGKCYAYITDSIVHIGEHQYEGRFADELKPSK